MVAQQFPDPSSAKQRLTNTGFEPRKLLEEWSAENPLSDPVEDIELTTRITEHRSGTLLNSVSPQRIGAHVNTDSDHEQITDEALLEWLEEFFE
jgi:hypothetical protein